MLRFVDVDIEPMLAGHGAPREPLVGWAVEPKLDGWRCRVLVDGADVTVRTRSGRTWPGLLSGIRSDGAVLLDGELVAGSGTARSFYSLGPRVWGAPK
jgi:ATP-dependent DNA ligase